MGRLREIVAGVALASAFALGGGVAWADNTSYNWGGLYFGANIGWSGVNFDRQWVFDATTIVPPGTSISSSQDDAIVGGHIGIQHQLGSFVVGVEAAFSSSEPFGSGFTSRHPFNGLTEVDAQEKLGPIFTIGPRLGWAPTSRWLLFIGGGYASATVQTKAINLLFGEQVGSNTSARHDGWYLGGGVEYALTPNWILGLEYQHVSLDERQHCIGIRVSLGTCLVPTGITTSNIDADIDIVRARVSYKLGRREPEALK